LEQGSVKKSKPNAVFDAGNAEYLATLAREGKGVTPDWNSLLQENSQAIAPPQRLNFETVSTQKSFPEPTSEKAGTSFYRRNGYLGADLDPLKLQSPPNFWFAEEKAFSNDPLKPLYCGTLSLQYPEPIALREREWLEKRFEGEIRARAWSVEEKKTFLRHLVEADVFETFIAHHFPGAKRFSLEGADAFLPALFFLVNQVSKEGIQDLALAMTHRGRLNTMVNALDFPLSELFQRFQDKDCGAMQGLADDVKYHLGAKTKRSVGGGELSLTLLSNPSHLGSITPVLLGVVKGLQCKGHETLGVVVHGDAAFCGQGVVAETLNFQKVAPYDVGGLIHVVLNNQIGFTAEAPELFSGYFPTDMAAGFHTPILHVNGDAVEDVIRAFAFALDYRLTFGRDVVIHIMCYRRFGHNESDSATFTNPLQAAAIQKHPRLADLYGKACVAEGVLSETALQEMRQGARDRLEEAHGKPYTVPASEPKVASHTLESITSKTLKKLAEALTTLPENFAPHPKVKTLFEKRRAMLKADLVDWAFAEQLAFASLLVEGQQIRFAGQDVGRGTFSHRHAILKDVQTGAPYVPLNHVGKEQGMFEIFNTPLSEFAAMGVELGYTWADPKAFVLWEAQFGDFVNGASIVIDQYLSAMEAKWGMHSNLTLLLPHGYEGQGPEHSSARLERFLQLCGEENITVAQPTTPANYFHLLRSQALRSPAKPLVVMTPKSLLRNPEARSSEEDFVKSEGFQSLLTKTFGNPDKADILYLMTGKVFYDFVAKAPPQVNAVVVCVEQLYPFPEEAFEELMLRYQTLDKIVWVQEEPQNMGAWAFVFFEIQKCKAAKGLLPTYIGRSAAASPATGFASCHLKEQGAIIEEAWRKAL
jgi:2-oxoglutarate dehydrogenase E1 component